MKCLSIAGKYCSITTEEGKRTPIRRNGQYRNQYTLGKARQQRLAGLRRTLCSLAVPPKLFITIIIPNNGRQPFDYPTCRKVFNSFTKKLKYHFKKSWFIYKCEWKENVGFHFHMLGNLFKKSSLNFSQEEHQFVEELWDASLASAKIRTAPDTTTACCIKPCEFAKHVGYITKPEKWSYDIGFIKMSVKSHMWGCIGKKNIKFAPQITAKVSERACSVFLRKLKYKLSRTKFNTRYLDEIKNKKTASICYIDNEIMLEALREACKAVRDGSAVKEI